MPLLINPNAQNKTLSIASTLLTLIQLTLTSSTSFTMDSLDIHQLDITSAQKQESDHNLSTTIFITIFTLSNENVHTEGRNINFTGHPLTWGYIETSQISHYNDLKTKFKKMKDSSTSEELKEILKGVKDYLNKEKLKLTMQDQCIKGSFYVSSFSDNYSYKQDSLYENELGDYRCKFEINFDTKGGNGGKESKLVKATGYNLFYKEMAGNTGPNVKITEEELVSACKETLKEMASMVEGEQVGLNSRRSYNRRMDRLWIGLGVVGVIAIIGGVVSFLKRKKRNKKRNEKAKINVKGIEVTQAIPVNNY